MSSFLQWLTENGVDVSAISIDHFADAGLGLKATRDIEVPGLYILLGLSLV